MHIYWMSMLKNTAVVFLLIIGKCYYGFHIRFTYFISNNWIARIVKQAGEWELVCLCAHMSMFIRIVNIKVQFLLCTGRERLLANTDH